MRLSRMDSFPYGRLVRRAVRLDRALFPQRDYLTSKTSIHLRIGPPDTPVAIRTLMSINSRPSLEPVKEKLDTYSLKCPVGRQYVLDSTNLPTCLNFNLTT